MSSNPPHTAEGQREGAAETKMRERNRKWDRGKWRLFLFRVLSCTPLLHRERIRMIPGLCSSFAVPWADHCGGIKASQRTTTATGSTGAAWAQAQDSNWFHCHNHSLHQLFHPSPQNVSLILTGMIKVGIEFIFSKHLIGILLIDWLPVEVPLIKSGSKTCQVKNNPASSAGRYFSCGFWAVFVARTPQKIDVHILWNSDIPNIFWNNTEPLTFMTDVHNWEAISVCIMPSAQHFIWNWFDIDIPPHSINAQSSEAVLMPSLCQHIPTPQRVLLQLRHKLQWSPSPKEVPSQEDV